MSLLVSSAIGLYVSTAMLWGGTVNIKIGGFLLSLLLILPFLSGFDYYLKSTEYSTKEYKTEQVRTEIVNGDTTVYFKIVEID